MEQKTLPLDGRADRKIRRLTLKEQHTLNNFVQGEYVPSKLTDVAFAVRASEFLNLPGINARHIASAREIFDIPSNRDVERVEKRVAPSLDLSPIEDRLLTLEKQVRKLFARTEEAPHYISDKEIVAKRDELYKTHSAESGDFRAIALVRWALGGGK